MTLVSAPVVICPLKIYKKGGKKVLDNRSQTCYFVCVMVAKFKNKLASSMGILGMTPGDHHAYVWGFFISGKNK